MSLNTALCYKNIDLSNGDKGIVQKNLSKVAGVGGKVLRKCSFIESVTWRKSGWAKANMWCRAVGASGGISSAENVQFYFYRTSFCFIFLCDLFNIIHPLPRHRYIYKNNKVHPTKCLPFGANRWGRIRRNNSILGCWGCGFWAETF